MAELVKVCDERSLVLLANKPPVPLVSRDVISKGVSGECGRHVRALVYKLVSVGLCPPLSGQIGVDSMVRKLRTVESWMEETNPIHAALASRMQLMAARLNMLPACHMEIPEMAAQAARDADKGPDAMCALVLLDEAGIYVLPEAGPDMGALADDPKHARGKYVFNPTARPPPTLSPAPGVQPKFPELCYPFAPKQLVPIAKDTTDDIHDINPLLSLCSQQNNNDSEDGCGESQNTEPLQPLTDWSQTQRANGWAPLADYSGSPRDLGLPSNLGEMDFSVPHGSSCWYGRNGDARSLSELSQAPRQFSFHHHSP
ncbi:Alanine aminotransferase [Mycena kentingensis (nom. inval.)]|nr:Alanine aminotransferase [Mycena kentingensis (nom. inval.)]